MNSLKLFMIVSLTMPFAFSCISHKEQQLKMASQYIDATITRYGDNHSRHENRSVTISGAQLDDLLKFFPGLGKGRTSPIAGGWIAGAEITFHKAAGPDAHVLISYDFTAWSEGHGDWKLDPKAVSFLNEVFSKDDLDTQHQ